MNLLVKILVIFTLTLILLIAAGFFFAYISFNDMQNTLAELEIELQSAGMTVQEMEEARSFPNHYAYFHAAEFLLAHAAGSGRTVPGPLPFLNVERAVHSLDRIFIEQGQRQIEELINDSGFIAYLETINLVLSGEPYENVEFVFFDFLTMQGRRIGSLGIQKRGGAIYLFDDEYVSLGAIQTFGLQNSNFSSGENLNLARLPSGPYERGRNHTVLIAGINQGLTDTLILAIANEETQEIDLISLPRDLFYQNRKINEIFFHDGPRQLVREMESMTGFEIDNFIIIDIYAFIDVVNILGGVEITLDAPLVDPSYRVRNNGHWSTLFYPAGTHHLNGIEALRVARSRHFISDFGRSRHQQLILTSIIDKITGLGIYDIRRVYELALVFMRYVETDFTNHDLIRNILRFRSARVKNQVVFGTGDILYATYINLLNSGLTIDEVDEDFNLGIYLLLPMDDDWSLIHSFIRSKIEDLYE